MEPLNKGHLPTEGIVPYSEVSLIGRFFRKSKIMMSNQQRTYQRCFVWKHYSASSCWHAHYTNNHGSKENPAWTNAHRTIVPGHRHYKLPRLPLDKLHNTVNHRKRSADSLVAAHFHTQNVIFGGGAHMWGFFSIRLISHTQ